MNYRPDKDRSLLSRHPGWRVSRLKTWLLILIVAAILFGHTLILSGIGSPLSTAAWPLLAVNKFFIEEKLTWSAYLKNQAELAAENKEFKLAAEEARLKLAAAEVVAEDYRHLRAALGQKSVAAAATVAQVVFGPARSPYSVLGIDLGFENSTRELLPGLPVGTGGILIGKIYEVEPLFSRVKLYSAPGEKMSAVIGPEKIPAEVLGRGGGNFSAILPRTVTVAVGDLVTAPLLGGRLLGEVGAVDNDPEEPFQTVYIKSPVNLYTLTWVEIYAH